jgi:DNA-binding response OmpR family regulator
MPLSSTPLPRVYIIEDDADLREEMVYGLGEMGFDVLGFPDAPAFYRAQAVQPCDVAVVDVGLPGEDGHSVARHLRVSSAVGIVMLTARGTLQDRLHGLQQGADAYLVKPVHLLELSAVLRGLGHRVAQHRTAMRSGGGAAPAASSVEGGDWRLTEAGWTLRDPQGRTMPLTYSERLFLRCLFETLDTPVSRDRLISALGGSEDFDPHRIDALASRLRRKAEAAGIALSLRAVRGVGYVFHSTALQRGG